MKFTMCNEAIILFGAQFSMNWMYLSDIKDSK